MSDKRISEYPLADELTSSDSFPVVQGGKTKRATPGKIPASLIPFTPSGSGLSATTTALQLQKSEFFESISALKAWSGPTNKTLAFVRGYYAAGDGGGGIYYWDEDSSDTDNGGTIITPTAAPASGRWLRQWDALQHSVKVFGAKGDAETDDSSAILACVNAAATDTSASKKNRAKVVIPDGIYMLGTSAALTPSAVTSIRGIHFQGEGMWTSILRLDVDATDLYFYNNGSTARTLQCSFADIGFEGMDPADFSTYDDISDNAKCFRLWSASAQGSHEQGFKFHRCRFDYLAEYMDNDGDQTSSECSWVQCEMLHIKNVGQKIDNLQSFNHEYHSCNFLLYGDLFNVTGNGGGAIKMWGGSVVMLSDKESDVFFYKQTVAGSGTNCFPFTFNGLRIETRGNTTNLVSLADTAIADIHFNDCFFLTTATSDLESYVKVGRAGRALFNGCTFKEQSTGEMQFHVITATRGYENGLILFERCGLPIDWSDRCFLDNISGHIEAINCYGTNTGAISTIRHYAHDFTVRTDETAGQVANWTATSATTVKDAGSGTGLGWRVKTAQLKLGAEFWPDTTEGSLRLPRNAIIKSIHIRKPAHASETTSVTLRVGRADKSGTDHAEVTAQWNQTHSDDVTNYFYCVGTTDNERNLLLYTDENPTAGIVGGLAIVEYY